MTLDHKTLLDELFQRYGHPSQEADFRITGYFQKAESLNKSADVQREDKRAAQMIEELSHKPESVKLVVKSHAHFALFCSEISLTTAE